MKTKNGLKILCLTLINIISTSAILFCRQFTLLNGGRGQGTAFSLCDCLLNKSPNFPTLCILGLAAALFSILSIPLLLLVKGRAALVPCFFITLCEILIIFYIIFFLPLKIGEITVLVNSVTFFPMLLAFADSLTALLFFTKAKN